MKEKDGFKYSQTEFEGYTNRALIKVHYAGDRRFRRIEIYTDNPDRYFVETVFRKAAKKQNPDSFVSIDHWSTAEQDKAAGDLIDLIENL